MAKPRRSEGFSTRFNNVTKSWTSFVYWAIRNLLEPYEVDLDYNVITGDVNLIIIKDKTCNKTYKIPKEGFTCAIIDSMPAGASMEVSWTIPDKTKQPKIDFITDRPVYPLSYQSAEFFEVPVVYACKNMRQADLENPDIDNEDAFNWEGAWESDFEYCRSFAGPDVKPRPHKKLNLDLYDPLPSKEDIKSFNKLTHGVKRYGVDMDWESELYSDKYAERRNPKNWPKPNGDVDF